MDPAYFSVRLMHRTSITIISAYCIVVLHREDFRKPGANRGAEALRMRLSNTVNAPPTPDPGLGEMPIKSAVPVHMSLSQHPTTRSVHVYKSPVLQKQLLIP